MSNLARVRQASIKFTKVQRRIWLFQTVFWPVVAVTCIVTAIAAGWVWRRRNTAAESNDLAVLSDDPVGRAKPTDPRLNSAPSGNFG